MDRTTSQHSGTGHFQICEDNWNNPLKISDCDNSLRLLPLIKIVTQWLQFQNDLHEELMWHSLHAVMARLVYSTPYEMNGRQSLKRPKPRPVWTATNGEAIHSQEGPRRSLRPRMPSPAYTPIPSDTSHRSLHPRPPRFVDNQAFCLGSHSSWSKEQKEMLTFSWKTNCPNDYVCKCKISTVHSLVRQIENQISSTFGTLNTQNQHYMMDSM